MRYVLIFFLFSTFLNAQEFYLLNGENEIYTYEYSTGTTQFVIAVNVPSSLLLTDIAYADEDHFYGIDANGTIINIDLATGEYDTVYQWPGDLFTNGLVYNNNHLTFINAALNELVEYDINANTISQKPIGTGNSGDITYYKGNLLFQGTNVEDVLAYDGNVVKSVACADSIGLWGMANFSTSCGTNLLLAFGSGGKVWEYDIEGQTYSLIDDVYSAVGGINGATTINEQFAYDCNLVALEEVYCKFLRDDYVFVCEYNNNTEINSIGYVDTGYNHYPLIEMDLSGTIILDIAFSSEGLLYGITDGQEIIQIFGDSTTETIAPVGGIEGYNGLVGNASNQFLLIGSTENKVLTFDLATNSIISEFEIPEGSPGDATFFKGNLLYQGMLNDFYAYDGTDSQTVFCNDITPFRAISNRFVNCQSNDVIAITDDGVLYRYQVQGTPGLFFERNIASQADVIYGAANRLEYMASVCTLVPLDYINCDLGVSEATYLEIDLYPNPANNVLYINTHNFSEVLFYSMYSIDGKLLANGIVENELSIRQLVSGVYFLKLYNIDKTVSAIKRFIKN
ncbi:T9SS type A sorting domain-containing protein [Ulvibacter antarcticus]|uniref:Putative secreted protein (Por secretion system target) n=1 Tax=Ulvibacter antarcticus TaxID=442714 RepID=A0A3L9Z1G7_9FLAO|nr:T9SS type A sorting domain-containing protein [Ulvibacter antarcticus]RMA66364.1 putative secreted protein (Por secretion system target) [Ulvibacter antarcticus]